VSLSGGDALADGDNAPGDEGDAPGNGTIGRRRRGTTVDPGG
jgi:hypothetical protein